MIRLHSKRTITSLAVLVAAVLGMAAIPSAKAQINVLYSFCSKGGDSCTDGLYPVGGLVQGADGNFYGTTSAGGAYWQGNVFKITPQGALTTLYSFCSGGSPCSDGGEPQGTLIQGTDGNFYGTTSFGGTGSGAGGTVFKITPDGVLTTLYNFCSQGIPDCADGNYPYGALVQGTDGNFYGTTESNGWGPPYGTIFKITPDGTFTNLHSFCSGGWGSGCPTARRPMAA